MLESLCNKVTALQLSCEYSEIFKNSFFHKTPPVAASEKFINFPGKHQWQRRKGPFIKYLHLNLVIFIHLRNIRTV